ncbi:hypothetical protein [Nocardia terpenica]|uniref:Outer membrane channel protein CpnT-like N-terminal domain-containing protein n=1 Tax=Nocardia terpenica TaxID=455432 RepID=A0A164I7M1_9NOCA|nr:hypothetical protein [Nocardia terpenica]KZM69173.1 hypothetical protein AWN90_15770 [Nocardia terpenica]NQE87706.1 hypothetical protein [Nocardia terpenica]
MSITSLWEWIPSWILDILNFGAHYPEGDEDSLFALGDAWNKAGADIEKLIPHMHSVTDDTQKCYVGDGAEAVRKQFSTLYDGGDASMQKLAQGLKDLGHYTRNGGTQIESTKIQEAVFAGITAYTIIALIADFPFGELGVPFAAAAGRAGLEIAAEQGGRVLAEEAASVGMRTLLKQIVKTISIDGLKVIGKQALEAGVKGFGMGVGLDVGTQGIEMLEGHRDDGFSLSEAMKTGFEFGVGGMIGAPVGKGAEKLLGDAVSPFMNKVLSGAIGGATGGVGMYGAGIAWQVGDQLAHGNFDWSKVDTTFDPQLVIAGAGMGAVHGAKDGAELLKSTPDGQSARTEVSAGDTAAATRPEVTAGDASSTHPSAGDTGTHPADTVPARASTPPETSTAPTDSHTSTSDSPASHTDSHQHAETNATPASTDGARPGASVADRPTSTTPAADSGTRSTAPGGDTGTRPTTADTAGSDRGSTAPADRGAGLPADRGTATPDRGAGPAGDRGAGTPSDRGAGTPADRGAGTPADRGASRAGAGTASDPNAKVVAGQQDRPVAPTRSGVESRPQVVGVTPEARGAVPDARPAAQTGTPGDVSQGHGPADTAPGRGPETTTGGRGPADTPPGPDPQRPLAPYPDGRGAGEGGRPGAGDGARPDTRAAQTQSTRSTGDGRREGADTPGAPGITPIDTRAAEVRGGETRAGDGRPSEVRAGDGRPGDTRAGDGRAGDTRTGDRPGRDDHGTSGDGPADHRPGEGDVQSGGAVRPRDVLDTEAQDAWAEQAYDRFRLADNDVAHMADHLSDVTRADGSTGFGHDEISRVKEHLFREEHPLTVYDENGKPVGTEMRRYDADADIAEAWMRLSSGRALPEDIVLLEHEIAEAKYYDEHPGASYRDAHVEANKNFDWESNIPGRTGENIEGWSSEHGHIPGVSEGVRDGAGSDVPVRRGGSSVESRTDDQQGGSHRQSGGREDRPAGDQGRREGDDHTPQGRNLDSGGDHSGVGGGEHAPVAEVIDGAKSWIDDRPGDFRLDYSDSQLHEIVSEGRGLGLGDDTIQDFIKIGSRGDKPVTADALIEQMHNWVEVQDRGYPFKFTGPEDFENFRNDLVDGLREAGILTGDIAIQGSSLRTPHANDVDLAVFVDQAHFDKMVVDHFDGKVKLKSGEQIPLGDLSHSQLVELSRNILADTNREVYNAHARTFANAIDEGIVNSKSKVSPGLKGVSKAIQEKYPHLNVESVSALVHDGPFDTKPAMRVPDRATGPETENLGGARESAPRPPKQSGGKFVPPDEEPRPTTPSEDHPVVADEHGPAERSVESVVESAKSRIEANAKFRLEYSDSEMRSLVEEGRRLGIDDHTIEEFLKVGSRDAKRIGADELATQMHNYVEVVQERGYPYKFTDATDYESFRRDLIDGLERADIPTDDVVVQGSSLRTPRAGDVDLAVFVGRDEFNKMLIDRFDGRIKLKSADGPIDLKGRTPAELVDLAREIAANESGYNAQAKTFKNAVLNDIISSKLDISKPLKAVAKDMQRLHPDQNVESVSVLVRGGEFDTRPTMKVEHPDAPPRIEDSAGSAESESETTGHGYRRATFDDLGYPDGEGVPPEKLPGIQQALPCTEIVPTEEVRFTQRSVSRTTSDGQTVTEVAEQMAEHGWRGGPVHAVIDENGRITSLDNRRLKAARMAGLTEIPTAIHAPTDRLAEWPHEWNQGKREGKPLAVDIRRLPDGTLRVGGDVGEIAYRRGQVAETWGEIALFRAAEQRSLLPGDLTGSDQTPVYADKPPKAVEFTASPKDSAYLVAEVSNAHPVADRILTDFKETIRDVTNHLGQQGDPLEMRGEDHRVKTADSLERKYGIDAKGGESVADFLGRVNDLVRFSIRLPEGEHYTRALEATLEQLQQRGYTVVDVKNFWRDGNRYFGMNTTLRTPDGRLFEVQFPTDAAWRANKLTHEFYEVFRRLEEPIERRVHAFLQILRINHELGLADQVPPGLERLWPPLDTSFAKWARKNPFLWQRYSNWLIENGRDLSWITSQFGLDVSDILPDYPGTQ